MPFDNDPRTLHVLPRQDVHNAISRTTSKEPVPNNATDAIALQRELDTDGFGSEALKDLHGIVSRERHGYTDAALFASASKRMSTAPGSTPNSCRISVICPDDARHRERRQTRSSRRSWFGAILAEGRTLGREIYGTTFTK